ncbi:MAG TPA: lysozyme [Acidobacteriota bacterium]|nr:lysozyme [Acidobacteriota bacterium]
MRPGAVIAFAAVGAGLLLLMRRAEAYTGYFPGEGLKETIDPAPEVPWTYPPETFEPSDWITSPTTLPNPEIWGDFMPSLSKTNPHFMWPSAELRAALKLRESLRLDRYELGDGGVTIGYGHYEPFSRASLIPEHITIEEAEQMFDRDIEERAAEHVRMYVRVPLTQYEFDALVHFAYNVSPAAFKTVALKVNAFQDPYYQMLTYVQEGTHLEAGLRKRRAEEIAMFRDGIYAV